MNDGVLAVWSRVLQRLPEARLRVQSKLFTEESAKESFRARLQKHGIAPSRASLHGPLSREPYLAAHAEVDMILDTFPYPGGTTTCEAL